MLAKSLVSLMLYLSCRLSRRHLCYFATASLPRTRPASHQSSCRCLPDFCQSHLLFTPSTAPFTDLTVSPTQPPHMMTLNLLPSPGIPPRASLPFSQMTFHSAQHTWDRQWPWCWPIIPPLPLTALLPYHVPFYLITQEAPWEEMRAL